LTLNEITFVVFTGHWGVEYVRAGRQVS
jgi:hypothetical protein